MKHWLKSIAFAFFATATFWMPARGFGQSADWQSVVWREPQARYLLADLCLNGGKTDLYRKYAVEEKDPDSREAIRLWDAGVRVVNTNDFERKWVPSQFAKDGKMMRIVLRGSDRTITGNEVLLSSDRAIQQAAMRLVLADLTLSPAQSSYWQQSVSASGGKASDPSVVEAVRRWKAGARVLNAHWFEAKGAGKEWRIVYRGTDTPADGAQVRLNCDLAYPEVNVRYFMADMALGGSRDFYWRTAEVAHEMGCLEAVLRHDAGVKLTNLDQFERQQVDGKTVITRKGSKDRISGVDVSLSTD